PQRHTHRAHAGRREILAGIDRQHPGRGLRRAQIHPAHHGMRMRRAQHETISLAGQGDVVLKAAIAAQQALILETPHRLSDSELAHRSISPPSRRPGESRDPPRCEMLKAPHRPTMMMPYWIAHASGKVDPGFRRDTDL